MAAQDASSTPSQSNKSSYADRDLRITKENLFMVLALWMERFPVERVEVKPYKRVGAVLVLPSDMIYAVDCSRNGVHGVARLLMAHPDILQDCKIFVSRKPCSLCAKLLVQSKIKRVFYLPIEPEYLHVDEFESEMLRVDSLFKVSAIGQSVFVPKVEKEVFDSAERKQPTPRKDREEKKEDLMKTYWKDEWMKTARKTLPWPAFDVKMEDQVKADFLGITEWIARILVGSGKEYAFKAVFRNETTAVPFDPEINGLERKQALHLITVAKFLAERSDDPRIGVGAVIINKEKDVVALGLNGFPTKAIYGEFPRTSDEVVESEDEEENASKKDNKFPYVIHAEQNALLMRNTKNIAGGTLFVTKTPCDECTPLLEMQGIKTVVLGVNKMKRGKKKGISYIKFPDKADKGDPMCFVMEVSRSASDSSVISPNAKRRKLDYKY